jgi:hypothetical protein
MKKIERLPSDMIEQILAVSREMVTLAERGEWERVEVLQQERQQLIKDVFPLDASRIDQDFASETIQAILDLDKQLLQLALAQQKEIGTVLGKLNQGRQATKAYHTNARS